MFEIDQPLQVLLVLSGVLHREEAAPRLAEQEEVVAVEAERSADLLDLVDEPRDVPQDGSSGWSLRRAELVVVVVLDARAGEPGVEAS